MESRIHEFGCWFTSIKEERFLYIMNGEGSVCFFAVIIKMYILLIKYILKKKFIKL